MSMHGNHNGVKFSVNEQYHDGDWRHVLAHYFSCKTCGQSGPFVKTKEEALEQAIDHTKINHDDYREDT
jgi:hypothetical protein